VPPRALLHPGAGAIPPSAVERLIASRIAVVHREARAELERAAELGLSLGASIPPPTADERATVTFAAWVRVREPDFFMSAPMLNDGCRFFAGRAYEQRLEAYGRAWSRQQNTGSRRRRERFR
jgi:hypothetical protein